MRNLVIILTSVLVLAGCAAPKVQYDRDPQGMVKAPRFQRADSLITFAFPTKQGPVGPTIDPSTVQVVAVPVSYSAETWSIAGTRGMENWGVSTMLQVTHRPNTLMLQEIGSQVIDHRVQTLTTLGQLAGNAVAIFAAGAPAPTGEYKAPDPTSLQLLVKTGKCQISGEATKVAESAKVPKEAFVCSDVDLGGNYWVASPKGTDQAPFTGTFTVEAVPNESTDATKLQSSFASDSIFYSACRNVRVDLQNRLMGGDRTAMVRVSDPAHIEWLGLPDKGKITFGASCGADVVAEDANLPSGVDLANALIGAAEAVKKQKEGNK